MDEELSLKQRRFIKAYIQTGNATQAAEDDGYECKTDAAYAEMGSRPVRKVEGTIRKIMAEICRGCPLGCFCIIFYIKYGPIW
jgi:phage terminase small subunit